MTNVAHAKKSPAQTTECPCGWGRHCRCLDGTRRFRGWALIEKIRTFLEGGADLTKRRRALEALRDVVDAYDEHERDTKALRALYAVLPRPKDVELVQRITCDDCRAPQADEEIAETTRTPLEHVRHLRALVVDAYEGRPLRVPRAWRAAARTWRARAARRGA